MALKNIQFHPVINAKLFDKQFTYPDLRQMNYYYWKGQQGFFCLFENTNEVRLTPELIISLFPQPWATRQKTNIKTERRLCDKFN